jgi:hypothetical protein
MSDLGDMIVAGLVSQLIKIVIVGAIIFGGIGFVMGKFL